MVDTFAKSQLFKSGTVSEDDLDLNDITSFLRSDAVDTATGNLTFNGVVNLNGTVNFDPNGQQIVIDSDGSRRLIDFERNGSLRMSLKHVADQDTFNFDFTSGSNLQINGNRILTTADEGSGNGLNADTLDGSHASAFATSAQGTKAETAHGWGDHSAAGYLTSYTDTNTYVSSGSVSSDGDTLTLTLSDSSTVAIDVSTLNIDTDTNTTYSTATSSTLGLVKIGYTENNKNYPVELSSGKMYVNVPWTDTDTNTQYTAGTGLSLSGTTFSNSAPDQTVTLTGSGATSISGTYPNFTISSTDTNTNTTYSAGTGLTLNGTTFSSAYPVKSTDTYESGSNNEDYALLASVTLSSTNKDAYAEFHVVMAGRNSIPTEVYKVVVRADYSSSYRNIYVEPVTDNSPHGNFDPTDFVLAWNSNGKDHYVYIKSNDGWQIPYVFPLVYTSTDEDYVEGDWVFPSDGSWVSTITHDGGSKTASLLDKRVGTLQATTDVRAPIFYDSGDTSKYLDIAEYDGWRLKNSTTVSNNANLTYSWTAGTIKKLKISLFELAPSTDSVYLALRFGTGTTYSTGYYYYKISPSYTSSDYYYGNQSYMRLNATTQGNNTNEKMNGDIIIYPGNGQGRKHCLKSTIAMTNTGGNGSLHVTQGHHYVNYDSSVPMNTVQIFFSSGNLSSGKIQFYEMED